MMNETTISRAKELLESGYSLEKISAELGISRPTIAKYLRQAGVEINSKPQRQDCPDPVKLKEMYCGQRMSLTNVAEYFGVQNRTARRWLTELNIPIRDNRQAQHLVYGREINIPSKEELTEVYQRLGTMVDVAKHYGVSNVTISNWMKTLGIERRSRSEIQSERSTHKKPVPSRDKLYDLYITKGHTAPEVAELYGVHETIVRKWLRKYNIPRHTSRREKDIPDYAVLEALFNSKKNMAQICDELDASHTTVTKWFRRVGLVNRPSILRYEAPPIEELTELYLKQHWSTYAIAQKLGVSDVLVRKWLEEYGIDRNGGFRSQPEIELTEFVNNYGFEFRPTRKLLGGYEVDAYDRETRLAIEYCGLFWHSERHGKDRWYHKKKMDLCQQKGVRLITIFEDEWLKRKEHVKNFILATLGVFERRIFAKFTTIYHVNSDTARQACEDWHIQGAPKEIWFAFGLYHEDELLGVVTFARHHRQSQNTLVLNRLCFKPRIQVVGGVSKLLKFALHSLNVPIVTWSDNRWSTGDIYAKCGFKLDTELDPDYSYTNGVVRRSKQSCQKKRIGCPPDMTEVAFMAQQGWHRIWDCGKKRWSWTPK